jgi:hypothetical protein
MFKATAKLYDKRRHLMAEHTALGQHDHPRVRSGDQETAG